MKKVSMLVAMILSAAMLAGCVPDETREVYFRSNPSVLQGCKVYKITADDGNNIYVARCDDRNVTTISRRVGKSGMAYNVTVEA